MSDSKKASDFRLDPSSGWANAYKFAGAVGGIGLMGTVAGAVIDPHRFAFSYLFAFMSVLMIALGAIFFCLIQWLTSSGWSVTVRRTTEFMIWPIWLFAILFVPVYLNMDQLYPWTGLDMHGEHEDVEVVHEGGEEVYGDSGETHGSPPPGEVHGEDPGIGDYAPETHYAPVHEPAVHHAHEAMLGKKVPYLNKGFFSVRMVVYFAAWIIVGMLLWRYSTSQDEDADPAWTVKMQRLAPVGIILIAASSTFAAFDWLMSLEPSWFSTIFGVNFFADCIVSMFATTILITLSLRSAGHFGKAVNTEHFHDLGKLLFGFMVFWAYVNFSQLMLIWYASIPEETTYYHRRWVGGWQELSIAIIFGHFIVPFFIVLSRNAKRRLSILAVGTSIVLLFHFVMVFWLVMPYSTPGHLTVHWLDFTALAAVAGLYFALVFFRMTKHPIIPVNDPRLSRAVHFMNA